MNDLPLCYHDCVLRYAKINKANPAKSSGVFVLGSIPMLVHCVRRESDACHTKTINNTNSANEI